MAGIPPPPYPRDHAQGTSHPLRTPAEPTVQPGPVASPAPPASSSSSILEFAETTSVCLEWKLSGLKAMYDGSKGDAKSKCIKSAVFGDPDNLWEVLWYPNSGVQGGDYASLYLSCVPTYQERDQGIGSKWTRKGLWWFRFEIRSTIFDERSNKIVTLATKDAADHTFAVKTANWGWQQFTKRDVVFQHPTVQQSDSFLIVCTLQAQPQPPAGYWLGLGLPPSVPYVAANTVTTGRSVGSGGGLSAWAGGAGASGGVAGGVAAGGGVNRVVPGGLVSAVGALLDDEVYSDIEFIIPPRNLRKRERDARIDTDRAPSPRRIYANKKLLTRCDYFDAMFHGGFREVEGVIELEDEDSEDEPDMLSDSDMEDEAAEMSDAPPNPSLHLTTTTSRASDIPPRRASTSADVPPRVPEHEMRAGGEEEAIMEDTTAGGEGHADEAMEEDTHEEEVQVKRVELVPGRQSIGAIMGPKKTRVMVRDAAWSTWWAVLYWLYTDIIYFAPLSSSFEHSPIPPTHSRPGSITSFPPPEPKTRREWVRQWMTEHGIGGTEDPPGPRPVSAKAVYRLADKLDLPPLKLRAFQHICSGLTASNIPSEVFSRFSSTFEDVRKVQVAFFLKHWSEIKKSETMTQIWQQIRLGKHVGFEEVWPLIVGQLDFKPS